MINKNKLFNPLWKWPVSLIPLLYQLLAFIRGEFLPQELREKLRIIEGFKMIPWYYIVIACITILFLLTIWTPKKGKIMEKSEENDKRLNIKDSEFTSEVKDADRASGMDLGDQDASIQSTKVKFVSTGHVKDGAGFRAGKSLNVISAICPNCNTPYLENITGQAPLKIKCRNCKEEFPYRT